MLPEFFVSFSTCRLLSDTGRSIAFDERGTGFGRGEGCGIIILKPLDQAVRDNDTIRAVIMGTGINQDGKTPGITMPSGEAQGMFYSIDMEKFKELTSCRETYQPGLQQLWSRPYGLWLRRGPRYRYQGR